VEGPSILVNSRARILVCVATLASVAVFVRPIAKAQPSSSTTTSIPTNWLITVVAPKGKTEAVTYSVTANPDASHGGCSYAAPPYTGTSVRGDVPLCTNDTIQWQGSSDGGSHELVVFVADQILNDTTFRGTSGSPSTIGSLTTSVSGDHQYYVVLYDKKNKQVHEGDPKIIIGGTRDSQERLLEEIAQKAERLQLLRPDDPKVKKLVDDVADLQKSKSLK
jgi:hypothetical protein